MGKDRQTIACMGEKLSECVYINCLGIDATSNAHSACPAMKVVTTL